MPSSFILTFSNDCSVLYTVLYCTVLYCNEEVLLWYVFPLIRIYLKLVSIFKSIEMEIFQDALQRPDPANVRRGSSHVISVTTNEKVSIELRYRAVGNILIMLSIDLKITRIHLSYGEWKRWASSWRVLQYLILSIISHCFSLNLTSPLYILHISWVLIPLRILHVGTFQAILETICYFEYLTKNCH